MSQTNLDSLMKASAEDAINYAKEQHQQVLDRSESSLLVVDNILSQLHQDELLQSHSNEMLFTLCNIFGAYIGEIFIGRIGGSWQHNEQQSDAPFVYVQYHDREFPFASICYHKITQNNDITIREYMRQAVANATS